MRRLRLGCTWYTIVVSRTWALSDLRAAIGSRLRLLGAAAAALLHVHSLAATERNQCVCIWRQPRCTARRLTAAAVSGWCCKTCMRSLVSSSLHPRASIFVPRRSVRSYTSTPIHIAEFSHASLRRVCAGRSLTCALTEPGAVRGVCVLKSVFLNVLFFFKLVSCAVVLLPPTLSLIRRCFAPQAWVCGRMAPHARPIVIPARVPELSNLRIRKVRAPPRRACVAPCPHVVTPRSLCAS